MNESVFQKNENRKAIEFKKNDLLNNLLREIKEILFPIQKEKEEKIKESKWPVAFIIGNPRSGTTLVLQWLASMKYFAYPSNFLTRFAYAPYVGALIQKMLFDKSYDFDGDFYDIKSTLNFDSNLGKSKGALATNEFQHFFRNYMPNFDPEYLNENSLKKIDFEGMKRGIATIERVFGKPFITKAVMLQYNLISFSDSIPNSFFIYVKRTPIFVMQSLLLAREKYYGNRNIWWSVKPKEYEILRDMDVYHQIAGQVFFTNKSIESELKKIPKEKKIIIEYEKFCRSPEYYYNEIKEIYKDAGYEIDSKYKSPETFKVRNIIRIDKSEINKLEKSYELFASKTKKDS